MHRNAARTIAVVGIWLSVAIILVCGVFRSNWNGDSALVAMLCALLIICGAATASTAFVCSGMRGRQRAGPRGFHVEPLPVSPD
jgi:hypothetical protein